MQQSIINKLPEVIKCIIYDHVSTVLNYKIELCSDKFIGNPITSEEYDVITNFYHINKLTKIKIPLLIIKLGIKIGINSQLPPQEILNKLQSFSIVSYCVAVSSDLPKKLPSIKFFTIDGTFKEIPNFSGLKKLNCSKCEILTEIPHIKGLLELKCCYCDNLTKIPHIVGLKKLECHMCDKLTKIPCIKGLLKLDCSFCDKLTKVPHIKGLKKLNCSRSDEIIKIPHIVGLKELNCSQCINITKIPHIMGLKILNCSICKYLTEIPHIKGLKELNCSGCDNLTEIPYIVGIKKLINLNELPYIKMLDCFYIITARNF